MPRRETPPFSNHRSCRLLTGLTLDHLPGDGSIGRFRIYRKGADVWRAEDQSDRIYFLQRGQVTVLTSDPQGNEVIMQVIGAGEPFGELCFCAEEDGLRHTIARAITGCEAVEIKRPDFVNYLRDNADALNALVLTFCIRLSDAERRTEILAHRGAEDRLGRLLLQLAATRSQPSPQGEGKVLLHVSHDELAQMAAMSRSHVTVTMGKLRRQGVVDYARNRPIMVNVPLLTNYLIDDNRGRSPKQRK
jgi:CRP/FNR family cyclic AMP-dependent transcriptional regulator